MLFKASVNLPRYINSTQRRVSISVVAADEQEARRKLRSQGYGINTIEVSNGS